MPPSGKLAAPWSVALTAALVLGLSAFFAQKNPVWPPAIAELATRVASIWFKPADAPLGVKTDPDGAPATAESAAGETQTEAAFIVPPLSWTHLQVEAALMECLSMLGPVNAEIIPLAPHAYGGCGTPAPILLRSLGGKDRVALDPPLLVNCPIIAALHQWLEDKVQPAARAAFGSPITRIVASSYACRTPYNLPSDRLSQHAFANAVDLPIFVLADGRTISVTSGWGPTRRDLVAGAKPKLLPVVAKDAPVEEAKGTRATGNAKDAAVVVKASVTEEIGDTKAVPVPDALSKTEAKFLRQVHQGACETFTTVLGPEANDVHRTHLHLDLQERNGLRVCK